MPQPLTDRQRAFARLEARGMRRVQARRLRARDMPGAPFTDCYVEPRILDAIGRTERRIIRQTRQPAPALTSSPHGRVQPLPWQT